MADFNIKQKDIMNVNFKSFKPYSYYSKEMNAIKKPLINKRALAGSALGVLCGMAIGPQIIKKGKIKNETVKEVIEMLSMAGLADIGSVLLASKNATKEQKKKKWREAGFQIMNTSIPMLMVSGFLEISKKVKFIDKSVPLKIIGSIAAMVSGAALATTITNLGKKHNEPKRKYSIKDSVANFDDVVATAVLGFPQYEKLKNVAKSALPFIYGYCGSRAGAKE